MKIARLINLVRLCVQTFGGLFAALEQFLSVSTLMHPPVVHHRRDRSGDLKIQLYYSGDYADWATLKTKITS